MASTSSSQSEGAQTGWDSNNEDSSGSSTGWDSNENPAWVCDDDEPVAPLSDEDIRKANTVTVRLQIPEHIQFYWYEWILFEIEEFGYLYVVQHWSLHHDPRDPVPAPGWKSPIDLFEYLARAIRNSPRVNWTHTGRRDDFIETLDKVIEFRHLAEHRGTDMDLTILEATLALPRLMEFPLRAARFDRVTKAIKAGCPENVETQAVLDIIMTRQSYPHPDIELCGRFVDDLRQCAFDRASFLFPERFPIGTIYKTYELKYWPREFESATLQDEITKCAFLDPNEILMRDTLDEANKIRNHFIHRNGDLNHERDFSGFLSFWVKVRAASKAALLLGDRDLAFDIEYMVRQQEEGLSWHQVDTEFIDDEVESIVDELLEPSSQLNLLCSWHGTNPSREKLLRERWVIIDVLVEGLLELEEHRNGELFKTGLPLALELEKDECVRFFRDVLPEPLFGIFAKPGMVFAEVPPAWIAPEMDWSPPRTGYHRLGDGSGDETDLESSCDEDDEE